MRISDWSSDVCSSDLLDIASLINAGRLPRVPVYIDSPLAGRATEVFGRHADALEDMGKGRIFDHPAFHYVETSTDSIALNDVSGAIIMAASGMCEGGRIRHHLRRSEEHTSELQSLMRTSYAVFCLKTKK